MKKEIKEFLIRLVNLDDDVLTIGKTAKDLLDKDFKEEVLVLWNWEIYNYPSTIERIKNKIDFIKEYIYTSEKVEFMNENWESIDQIIKILKEAVEERKEEETNE